MTSHSVTARNLLANAGTIDDPQWTQAIALRAQAHALLDIADAIREHTAATRHAEDDA